MLTVMHDAWAGVKRLASDEQGAEGLEKLLIFAAIVIPLLGLLMFFRNEITSFLTGEWDDVVEDADVYEDNIGGAGAGDDGGL